jgi:xanthine dehydrogenase accessory factor
MLEIYQELANIAARGQRAVLATVTSSRGSVPRKPGTKMIIRDDGSLVGSIGGGNVEQAVQEKAADVMQSGEPQTIHFDLTGSGEEAWMICGGQMDVFLEPVLPAETMYLFGAGHLSQTTAAVAKMLGFRVVVIDPRSEYNNNDRFPDADALVVEEYENAFPKLNVSENAYIVIYTPGHVSDEKCLQFAVGTAAKYVGMIGSKRKVKEIKERLRNKGVSQQQLDEIHAPIGLEINAETPEEIAISILGEITKVRRNQTPSQPSRV